MSITKTHEVFSLPNVHYALFCLYGIAWKNMVEMGRGGAYVPARVALQGRIHRPFPAHNACIFCYGNAATRTFGRAHRRRPYAFCLRKLHVGRLVSFGWIARGMVGGV